MTASGAVTVRFWASARAAAGTSQASVDVPGEVDLAWLTGRLTEGRPDLARVLSSCSVLVGDRPAGPAGGSAATSVPVRPGDTVEFLPPFAGG